MQVNLNPAGRAGHILAVVFCSPALEHMKMHHLELRHNIVIVLVVLVPYFNQILIFPIYFQFYLDCPVLVLSSA